MPTVKYNGKEVHFDYTPSGIAMAKKTAKKYNTKVIYDSKNKAEKGLVVPSYYSGGGVDFGGIQSGGGGGSAPLPVGESIDFGGGNKNKTKNKNRINFSTKFTRCRSYY